jgi:hypothetical protein
MEFAVTVSLSTFDHQQTDLGALASAESNAPPYATVLNHTAIPDRKSTRGIATHVAPRIEAVDVNSVRASVLLRDRRDVDNLEADLILAGQMRAQIQFMAH